MSELSFREGRASDLEAVYALGEVAWDESQAARGLIPGDEVRAGQDLFRDWEFERPLMEFMTAQPGGGFLVAAADDELAGFVIVTRFPGMDELGDLWVAPGHGGKGVSRGLLERCWAESPTPDLGRLVVAVGTPADLTLFTEFGVMPVSGHWHMRHRVDQYLEQRAQEVDSTEPGVHVLTPDRAVEEWKRLEPGAMGHERPALHEFFGRTRNCLATVDDSGNATALCWVERPRGDRPGRGQGPRGPRSGGARRARQGREDAGARDARRGLHHRVLVADGPPPPARLPRSLAGLDHVVRAAARPRPLSAHAPDETALSSLAYN